jgi:DNA-binding CsgD family transcriptional regulator
MTHRARGRPISPGEVSNAGIDDLPPSLRRALECLLEGHSEKEAAKIMGVTSNTFHGYVKQLYERLGVSSRAELMARWVRRERQ